MKTKVSSNAGSWKLDAEENVYVGNFNNVSDIETFGVFPGQFAAESDFKVNNENAESIIKTAYNSDEYSYSYFGNGYFYGIKTDNTEVLAISEGADRLIPVIEGAGSYLFTKRDGGVLLKSGKIKDYNLSQKDGYDCITVSYEAEGSFGHVRELTNTYLFKERCISVDAHANCVGLDEGLFRGTIRKNYINTSENYTKRVSYNWIYPENNDFVYKECDAVVFSEKYGDYAFFTALRDENSSHKINLRTVTAEILNLNLSSAQDQDIEYTCHIDYAVVKASPREAYEGLFMTRNANFAAGVSAVKEKDNTTMFLGKDLLLNLNVTNISDEQINFCAKYEIMDYYNRCVDSGTFYTNILQAGQQANHNIDLKLEKYGMYYLNFYVATSEYEYRECYPFAMLENFDFKYRDENPFGICATHTETVGEAYSTACMVEKMGLSFVRQGECYDWRKFRETLKEHGVKRTAKGVRWANKPEEVDKFLNSIKQYDDVLDDEGFAYFLIANEVDSPYKANYEKSKKYLEESFVPYTYKTAYDYISKNHPKALKKTIWQSNCHGTIEWLDAFYDTGMWDNSEIIDIHSYSSPSGPDKAFSNQMVSMYANTFSNEYAMDRWKRLTKRYGNKRMIVGETGYPTPPCIGDTAEIDIRTAADFNTRIALFFLEAGAEDVVFYCIYDRTGYYVGTSSWNEMYFGACYNYDYYGVYMPKPWAVAYSNMTRRFDGYKKVSFFDKYEESEFGTLRAFEVETKEDRFAVLWSNIYMQPNTTAEGRMKHRLREPMPAWENRWIKTEVREFDAAGDVVKVIDIMGNETILKAENGKVKIEVSGSPIYVYGIV